jgi:hypothetical protein
MHCAHYTNLKHLRKTIAIHDAKIHQNALVKNIDSITCAYALSKKKNYT